jgi:hypothetical protein
MAMMALFLAACSDDDPDTSGLDGYFESHPYVSDPRSGATHIVSVSPDSATVNTAGGRVVFTASGGNPPYGWDVSNGSLGTIEPSGSAQGVYTAKAVGVNDIIVHDQDGNAALARISGTAAGGTELSITAAPSTLTTNGAFSVVSVKGGTPPFTWTVASAAKGNFLGGNTGTPVTYTRHLAGDNVVNVTDGSGGRASLVISQP